LIRGGGLEMGKPLTTFYRVLEIFTKFLILNGLWLLFCIPIISIFSSTAAMFGVTRIWITKGIDYNIFKPFVQMFKENLRSGILLQIVWTVIGTIIAVDFLIITQASFWGRQIVFGLILFASIIYLMMSVYLFPVMVHFHLSLKDLLKNTLFMAMGSFGNTFLCLVFIGAMLILSYFVPFILLIFGSTLAHLIFNLCHRTFQKQGTKSLKREIEI
jgi:uncharacterized membrane protein YesL